MTIRLKYSKYGPLVYAGHLDFLRYMQRLVRRSKVQERYSLGFNPHAIQTFATPLGMYMSSDGEYMDMEVETSASGDICANGDICVADGSLDVPSDSEIDFDGARIVRMLNDAATEGCRFTACIDLPDWVENTRKVTAMTVVSAADYIITADIGALISEINEKNPQTEPFNIDTVLKSFLESTEITVSKDSKKGEKEKDIKPYIYAVSRLTVSKSNALSCEQVSDTSEDSALTAHCDLASDQARIEQIDTAPLHLSVRLAAGSKMNVRPELFIKAFEKYIQTCYNVLTSIVDVRVHKTETYQTVDINGENVLQPLINISY